MSNDIYLQLNGSKAKATNVIYTIFVSHFLPSNPPVTTVRRDINHHNYYSNLMLICYVSFVFQNANEINLKFFKINNEDIDRFSYLISLWW